RDSAVFNPTLLSAVNIHPDSAAVFPLLLGNAGSTNEFRNYLLSVVQQTNPDGLVVSVNGVIIENAINLTLPPGGGVQVMVTVKRGPLAYDYEGVQLFMQPECEPDPLHNGNFQLAATANITVHFLKPCSQVNITQPEPGWLINSSNRDTMQVSIAGYDASHPSLQNIKLQYRPSLKSNERSDNPEFFANAGIDASGKVRSINFVGLPVIPFSLAAKLQQRKTAAVEINSSFCESGYLMLNSYAKQTPKKYHLLTSYVNGSAQPAVTTQYLTTEESKVRYLQAERTADAKETPVKQRAAVLKSTTGLRWATEIIEDDPKSSWFTFKTLTKESLTGTNTFTVPWVVTGVDDGVYDIRAVTTCGGNTIDGTSVLITGTIDQTASMVQGLPQPVSGILTGNEQIAVSFTEQVQCYGLNTTNNIQLYYGSGPQSGQPIDINFTCDGRTIVITPNIADRFIENQVLKAIVKRVKDLHGNTMKVPVGTSYTDSLSWEFVVQKSPVRWQGGDITIVKYPDETVQVTRQLVNSSGFPNSYFIRNIPYWLSVSSTAGTVPNQGNVPITFTIGTGLANGEYEVTITDSTMYGDQPLRVHVQVVCRPPNWIVDEAGFEYSMNIVGELFIDTAACQNTNDLVGVFVGQQLRGAAQLKQLNSSTFRVFITVYSDSVSGESLQMRVWDSSSCNEYGQIIEQFTFSSNAVLGTIGNPVRITATNQMIQQYSMKSGWTWISFNSKKADMSVSSVLSGLHPAPDKDIIKDQTSHAQFTSTGIWFGSLDTIRNEKMYLLKLTKKDSLSHVGYPVQPASSPIFLNAGWNYIGYLPQGSTDVNSALASLQPQNGDIIKSQFAFAIYDTAFGWFGDLPYMIPRLGYFIKISRQDTLIYPDVSSKAALPVIANLEPYKTIAGQPDWTINANDYQYSMSVVAKLAKGIVDSIKENIAVGLFAGNVCRGFAAPLYDAFKCRYLFYLTIYGNEPVGDSLLFRVYDAKTKHVLALMKGIRFEADKLTGNYNEAHEITGIPLAVQDGRIIPAEFSLSANYPNPFNPTTTIAFALPVESDVTITIYNIMGERVKQIVNGHEQAGFYSVVWDGRNDYSNIVASGVYIYSMKAGKYQATRKLTFIK
ncbi:MAG: T9SS type A sorting domain-containing protein, partial [Ignavibacteriales bacterium]|nr:T9SS type A sorting domain-containing protein [Ignavibacteriales bacterium]